MAVGSKMLSTPYPHPQFNSKMVFIFKDCVNTTNWSSKGRGGRPRQRESRKPTQAKDFGGWVGELGFVKTDAFMTLIEAECPADNMNLRRIVWRTKQSEEDLGLNG